MVEKEAWHGSQKQGNGIPYIFRILYLPAHLRLKLGCLTRGLGWMVNAYMCVRYVTQLASGLTRIRTSLGPDIHCVGSKSGERLVRVEIVKIYGVIAHLSKRDINTEVHIHV